MIAKTISFRLNAETYLKIEAIAAERGLSPGGYIKKRLEDENENIANDLKLLQADIKENQEYLKEILNLLSINKTQNNPTNTSQRDYENDNIILEVLMILREISQPAKVASAQKKMLAIGVEPYSILEK